MKKLLGILVLSLMLSSTHAYAICILGVGNCETKTEWKLVSMSADEDTKVYIDKQTVSKIGNNYSVKENNKDPEAIELTFSKKSLHSVNKANNKIYPIKNLDFSNSKKSPDIELFFEE